MGYRDATYVIFDGDEDSWAYRFMRGWKANENIDFDFNDAHDLDSMTSRAQGEAYVKRKLRERMESSTQVLLLVGEKTKNLHKFVRWEIDLAMELGLPIVVVNLNKKNGQDSELCPPIIRDACCVHVPYKMKAIQYALEQWPPEFRRLTLEERGRGWRYYSNLPE